MGSCEQGGDGVSVQGYWGQLRAWGITPTRRLSNESWIGTDRDGQTLHIDDPEWMTAKERGAALSAIAMICVGLGEND
jgi:hypothetical protein